MTFDREVWLAPDRPIHTIGNGTQADPFNCLGKRIEDIIAPLGKSVRVNLASGRYSTHGFRVPNRFMLSGSGPETEIVFASASAKQNFNYPQVRMFADSGWSNLFVIQDVTLDGNIQVQPEFPTYGRFKIEPVSALVTKGLLLRITIKNWGCNGADFGLAGFEAFPLSLETYSSGPPWNYDSIYRGLVNLKSDFTFLEISDCIVERGHFLNGGYCTGVFVKTNQPGQGDRQPYGVRETLAALVARNVVKDCAGIGLGCAFSENVLFEDNRVENSKCGVNVDTGRCRNLSFIRNQFLGVSQGFNIVPAPDSGRIEVSRNVIALAESFFNPILKIVEPQYYRNFTDPKTGLVNGIIQESDNFMMRLPVKEPVS